MNRIAKFDKREGWTLNNKENRRIKLISIFRKFTRYVWKATIIYLWTGFFVLSINFSSFVFSFCFLYLDASIKRDTRRLFSQSFQPILAKQLLLNPHYKFIIIIYMYECI